ncbi:MAG: chorismate mutase [Enterocloster sp.]
MGLIHSWWNYLRERMELCGDVAEYKIGTGKAVYDGSKGEAEARPTVTGMAHRDFNRQGVYELFSQIMTISRRLQYGILAGHGQCLDTGFTMVQELKREHSRIVYQGVEGAYSHRAALQYFGDDADVYHVPGL